MVKSETGEEKSVKQQLYELLESCPPIYSDAVRWAFARWVGISLSSILKAYPKVDQESMLMDLMGDDCFRVITDVEGDSEVRIQVTEKGRNQMIGLFFSKSQQRELKRLFKELDPFMSQIESNRERR